MSDERHPRFHAAVKEAKASVSCLRVAANLLTVGRGGYVNPCPGCGKKSKFLVGKDKWGCFRSGCTYNHPDHSDHLGLLQEFGNAKGYMEAGAQLLEIAGIANPYDEDKRDNSTPKPFITKAVGTPTPTPKPPEKKTLIALDDPEEEEAPPESAPKEEPLDPSLKPQEQRHDDLWQEIIAALTLEDEDRETLKKKRGFTDSTIDFIKFRSSRKSNLKKLAPLLDKYPSTLLLDLGIATIKKGGGIKINPQLCGNPEKDKEGAWIERNPVIIPYRDIDGSIKWIRPHQRGLSNKNYLKQKKLLEAFRSQGAASHPFFLLKPKNPLPGFSRRCVLTEGEHKAVALWQCGIPAVAVPGIYMGRNKIFLAELVAGLRKANISDIIIVFDSEDKTHRADPWKRFDTEVYGRFTAHTLKSNGFYTQVGEIPHKWRIDKKADWDGVLGQIMASDPAKGETIARDEFAKITRTATNYDTQDRLFGLNEKERIIHCKLIQLIAEPNVRTGGDEEENDARAIRKCHKDFAFKLRSRELADTLLSTRGCYFMPRPPSIERVKVLHGFRKDIIERLDDEEDHTEKGALSAALRTVDILIDGPPKIVSNFTIKCEYTIRTREHKIERLLRLTNVYGEKSALTQPTNKQLASSVVFREFCLDSGNFSWTAGQGELDALVADLTRFAAWREIRELNAIGYDAESKCWISGDCAFAPDGTVLFADDHDIIWNEGIGYRVDPIDMKEFAHQRAPHFFSPPGSLGPQETFLAIDPEKERQEVKELFNEFSYLMHQSLGDFSGFLAIGAMLSYAISPESVAKYHSQIGLWIWGRMGSGKTEIAKFLMQMWGFPEEYTTISLSSGTTAVGLDRILAQYSGLPVHLDEFRENEMSEAKIASLRNAFNRQRKSKGRADQTNRTRGSDPLTTALVTGEGSTTDAATRSRFVQITLSAAKRLPADKAEQARNFKRLLEIQKELYRLIRWILLNRAEFAKAAMAEINEFMTAEDTMKQIDGDRSRLVYGTAYASYKVFSDMLEEEPKDLSNIRTFAIGFAKEAFREVVEVNFVSKFWSDIHSLMERHPGRTSKFLKFAYCDLNDGSKPITILSSTEQPDGSSPCIILSPTSLYNDYKQDKATRREEPDLAISNLRGEIRKEPYWVPAPKSTACRAHRLQLAKGHQASCWVVNISLMEPDLQELFLPMIDRLFDMDDE